LHFKLKTQKIAINQIRKQMKLKVINNKPSLTDLIDINLDHAFALIDRTNKADRTKEEYKKNVVDFIHFLQKNGIRENSLFLYSQQLFNTKIQKQRGKGFVSDRTKKTWISAAAKFVRQFNNHNTKKIILGTEIEEVKIHKQHKEGFTYGEVLKIEQVINAIEKKGKRLKIKAMFELLAWRGLRQMEVQGIRIEYINFENHTIRFRRKGQRKEQDFSRYNAHKMPRRVMDAIKAYIDHLGIRTGYLFAGLKTIKVAGKNKRVRDFERPLQLITLRKIFTERAKGKTAGIFILADIQPIRQADEQHDAIHKSLHGLRHFIGTLLTRRGYTPVEIAKYLGHSTLDMVLTYSDSNIMDGLMSKLNNDLV